MTIEETINEIILKFDKAFREGDENNFEKKQEAIFLPYKYEFIHSMYLRVLIEFRSCLHYWLKIYKKDFCFSALAAISMVAKEMRFLRFFETSQEIVHIQVGVFVPFFQKEFQKIVEAFFDSDHGEWIDIFKSYQGYIDYHRTELYDALTQLHIALLQQGVFPDDEEDEEQSDKMEPVMMGEKGFALMEKIFLKVYKLFYAICKNNLSFLEEYFMCDELNPDKTKESDNYTKTCIKLPLDPRFFFEDHPLLKLLPSTLKSCLSSILISFFNPYEGLWSHALNSAKAKKPIEEELAFVKQLWRVKNPISIR